MALFPQNNSFYDDQDRNFQDKIQDIYLSYHAQMSELWQEAYVDARFDAGDQTLWNELYGPLGGNRRRMFFFNRIRRIMASVAGYQSKNRKSIICVPVENADQDTADQYTKVIQHINRQEGLYETVSQAFQGSLITGINLLHVWVDYRKDPISGNIKVDNLPFYSFMIDPGFSRRDLSDCNFIYKRSYFTKPTLKSFLPNYADLLDELPFTASPDDKFLYMPDNKYETRKYKIAYDEFYYRDYRDQKLLVDKISGETMEWRQDDDEKLRLFLDYNPEIEVVESVVPTVKYCIAIQGKKIYDGPTSLNIDDYPFAPVIAYFNPQVTQLSMRVQSLVRPLRDSQFLYNRRRLIELDALESQINSGVVYKPSALVDPKDVFKTGQGQAIALKDTAQMTDYQKIPPADIGAAAFQVSQSMGEEINQVAGYSEELLGTAEDDKAGILSMLRQGAGLTTLQPLFDGLDHSQKLLGRILLKTVQTHYTPGKVKRILAQEPSPQFYDKAFGIYDAAIEDGVNTSTQRQMQFAQMIYLREAGVNIPDEVILDAATFQNKNDVIKAVQAANQQKQQLEQAQAQAAMQQQEAQAQLAQARIREQDALANERNTRSVSNIGLAIERQHQSSKDQEEAQLAKIRALSELEDLDLAKLQKLIAMLNMIEAQDKAQEMSGQSNNLQSMMSTLMPMQQQTGMGG